MKRLFASVLIGCAVPLVPQALGQVLPISFTALHLLNLPGFALMLPVASSILAS